MVQSDGILLIKNKTKPQQKLPRRGKNRTAGRLGKAGQDRTRDI